ncbi:MAG: V-type ATP synthase subunit E [Ruminococcus sp.]|nr:V-type ATP synthase subunit E [Ruminococcus sp.]
MPGLNKILSTIEEQSRRQADALIGEAEKKTQKIRTDGDAAAQSAYDRRIEDCKAECEHEYADACSSAEAGMKRELLAYKIKYIDAVINNAIEKINSMPDEEYFSAVLRLAGANMRKGDGIMYFSSRDLARIPSDFGKRLNLLASVDGSSLKISDEPADIENGFILQYGSISENCSFSAIAEADRDVLRDKAAALLFK